jgi:hypothetical protein
MRSDVIKEYLRFRSSRYESPSGGAGRLLTIDYFKARPHGRFSFPTTRGWPRVQQNIRSASRVKNDAVTIDASGLNSHRLMEAFRSHERYPVPNSAHHQDVATSSCIQVFLACQSTGIASHLEADG